MNLGCRPNAVLRAANEMAGKLTINLVLSGRRADARKTLAFAEDDDAGRCKGQVCQ